MPRTGGSLSGASFAAPLLPHPFGGPAHDCLLGSRLLRAAFGQGGHGFAHPEGLQLGFGPHDLVLVAQTQQSSSLSFPGWITEAQLPPEDFFSHESALISTSCVQRHHAATTCQFSGIKIVKTAACATPKRRHPKEPLEGQQGS